jgi:hypothetical protein
VTPGDACGVGKAFIDDVLDAARRVVERNRLDSRILAEKVPALVKRYGMGKGAAHRAQTYSRSGNHVVHDSQQKLGLNEDVPREQQIRMLGDRASEGILDGDNGGSDRPALDAVEYFGGSCTGYNGAPRQHASRGLVAEGTKFALDRNLENGSFNCSNFHLQGKVAGTGKPAQMISFGCHCASRFQPCF